MPSTATRIQLLLLALLLLAGCKSFQEKKSEMRLSDTLHAYEATVRWGRLESAYDYLAPELRDRTRLPKELDNIRVTGYEALTPAVSIDETTATQRVSISYVLRDRQVQRTLTDDQIWRLQEDGKEWLRINPIPEFK